MSPVCRLLCMFGVVSSALAAALACAPPSVSQLGCIDDRDCDTGGGFSCDDGTGACVRSPADADAGRLDGGFHDGDLHDGGSHDGGSLDGGARDGGAGLDASGDGGQAALDASGAFDGGGELASDASAGLDGGGTTTDAGQDASLPADWWDPEWGARHKLRLHAVRMNLPLVDVPIRLPLDRVLATFDDVAPDGDDLRFIDDDGDTELSYEIVAWGARHEVFVKVPRIERRTDEDFIWLYYKNPGAPAGAAPADVWNADYIAVHHLEESPSGALLDSSSGGLHPASVVAGSQGAGLVGQAIVVTEGPITIPSLDDGAFPQGTATVEMWLKGSFSGQPGVGLFDRYDIDRDQLVVRVSDSGDSVEATAHLTSTAGATVQTPVRVGEWNYLAARLEEGDKGLALVGDDFIAYAPRPESFAPADQHVHFVAGFVGEVDELRISSVARSDSWLSAQWLATRDLFLLDGDAAPVLPAPTRTLARTPGELVLYDLDEAPGAMQLADTSSGTTPLPLTLAAVGSEHPSPVELVGGGLHIRASPAIIGQDEPTRVQDACVDGSLTVEVWLQLNHTLHDGPARIFSLAEHTARATFMLGQQLVDQGRDKPELVFRLTTSATSSSGNRHDVEGAPPSIPVTPSMLERPTHVVFTWNGGVIEGFVDGQRVLTRDWPGSCVADPLHKLVLGNDVYSQRPWTGAIYLAAVYDDVLTSDEIMANYAAGP